ncbi:MAG: PAS domain S-box protein [Methylobacterium frigidaeris]
MPPDRSGLPSFLSGGGECGALMRGLDWAATPLGRPEAWPPALKTLVGVMLGSQQPMLIVWGPAHTTLYNDGYAEMCGTRHPAALGRPFEALWHDIWDEVEPILARSYAGEATHRSDIAFTMHRNGYPEETHFAFGYTPVRDEAGRVAGMFCACIETTRQVKAERRLRESEARFRNMADHAPVMMWVTNAAGECTYLNRRWYDFTGQSEADGLGLGWVEATHPDDRGPTERAFLEANAACAPFRIEYRLRRADGTYRWAIDAAAPRFGPDGDFLGYVGSVIDIDERREIEDALRASEARFQTIANSIDHMVWSTRADGFHDFYNQRWYDYTGVPEGTTDGEGWSGMFHPDDQERAWEVWRHSLATGEPYQIEYRLRHRSGAYRWVLGRAQAMRDAAGRIVRWFGTCTDIHDQVEAREVLARSRESLAREVAQRTAERDRIWQATSDLLCVATLEGRFVSLNPAWSKTLGWSEAALKAEPFLAFVHPDDREATLAAAAGLERGEPQFQFENRYRHRDGSYRWLSWNAVPRDGVIFATVRDVTAVKQQAETRRELEEQLRQSQKMEAVGQLTGGLAHDFNNLLAGITGSLELMQSRMRQGRVADVERYITAAQGAAQRAAALTHRLLAFSRRQTLDPKPTDVNRLVSGMEDLIRRTVGPAVAVDVVGAAGLWSTLVDPNQLENALLNLCINARDAMPEGGRITVETANRWLDERAARMRDLPPGQYLSLCVSDTGTGMDPEVQARAFDPFFTTKPLGQGTGLGLSMIHGFVRQSGGQVRIYSEPGQGTTVCLYLPRHYGEADDVDDVLGAGAPPRAEQGETVLVVDDEPTVRMLVSEVLEDLGYTAIEAADGPSGLKVLQSDVRIDLLITDVGLPGGMNGRQVADAGRWMRPDLKVLFITGFAENAVLGSGQLEPGMQVMTKPFVMEALATRIRDMIGE